MRTVLRKCFKTDIQLHNKSETENQSRHMIQYFKKYVNMCPPGDCDWPHTNHIYKLYVLLRLESKFSNFTDEIIIYTCDTSIDTMIVKLGHDFKKCRLIQ